MRLILPMLLLLASNSLAQTVTLPAEIKGEVGEFVPVEATTDCTSLKWVSMDRGLSVFPNGRLKDTTATVVAAMRPGRYRLLAYGAKGDKSSDPAITTIVVGESGPLPSPPEPIPTPPKPIPPVPPTPVPDALVARLQAAFDLDPMLREKKLEAKIALWGLYSAMISACQKPTIDTVGKLLSDYREAMPELLSEGTLRELRKITSAEIVAVAGADPNKTLDDATRKAFVEVFTRLAKSLEGVK